MSTDPRMESAEIKRTGVAERIKKVRQFGGKRRSLTAVAALLGLFLVFSIGGISVLGYHNISALDETKREWRQYIESTEEKSLIIEGIYDNLGYGGLIHNFKNYVLRKEGELVGKIERNFANFDEDISRYRSLGPTQKELEALAALEGVINNYRKNFEVAKRAAVEGLPAEETDARVRVDDSLAIMALADLKAVVLKTRTDAISNTTQATERATEGVTWTFLMVPVLVFVGIGVVGILVVLLKVDSEKEEFQNLLAQSEERLSAAFAGADEGYWDWDVENQLIYVSDSLQQIIGYDTGDIWIPVESWDKLIHPEDRARFSEAVIDMIRGEVDQAVVEHRRRGKDGKWVWVLLRGRVVRRSLDGRAKRACGVLSDITQIKAAEFALAESRRILIEAIEALPDAFVLFDHDDKLVICNENYKKFYPVSAPILEPGRTFEDIIRYGVERGEYPAAGKTKEEQEEWIATRLAAHRNPTGNIIEHKVESGRWLRIAESRTSSGGIVGFRIDITELKEQQEKLEENEARLNRFIAELEESRQTLERQAVEMTSLAEQYAMEKERAEAADRSKSEFLATMSHEIRTPMAGVLGMVEALMEGDLTPLQARQASMIQESGVALLDILNDILDLSKLEAGRFDIEEIDFDLRDAVGKVIALLWSRAEEKGLVLKAEIPSDLETSVSGDPSRLRQILINLVGNAIKFTHEGEVLVHVSVERQKDGISYYLFRP